MSKKFVLAFGLAGVVATAVALAATGGRTAVVAAVHPLDNDYQFVEATETPPTEAQCFTVNSSPTVPHSGRRCFTPQSIRSAYNIQPVYDQGFNGKGQTIAIIDSYGSDTMPHDLWVFNNAFGLPHLCGEVGASGPISCSSGMANIQ
jgi:subtilase family serine protease